MGKPAEEETAVIVPTSLPANRLPDMEIQNRLYQQYSFEEIFKNLAVLTLRGICTDKGLKLLDKLL